MKFTYPQYHAFSAPLEGDRVPTMYCDCLGLITVGTGNLINRFDAARALPWKLADGSRADMSDVGDDWHKLANGRAYYAARKWTVYTKTMRCHLEPGAVDALCQRQLAANEAIFRKRWSDYDKFPADAQLAMHSMAWAVGAGFATKFVHLADRIDAQDWEGCVASCKIREEGNPGVVPRNAKNRFCLHNAAIVKTEGGDPDKLWWPAIADIDPYDNLARELDATHYRNAAELAEAAWQAHELSREAIVPGAGRAVLNWENS
jgi:GH24 family phage-related lysozyme (muramidase)